MKRAAREAFNRWFEHTSSPCEACTGWVYGGGPNQCTVYWRLWRAYKAALK